MTVPAPVSDVLSRHFLGNSVQVWLTAGVTAAIALLAGLVLRRVLISRLGKLAERTTNNVDDTVVEMLKQTRNWVIIAVAILIALSPMNFPPRVAGALAPAMKLV